MTQRRPAFAGKRHDSGPLAGRGILRHAYDLSDGAVLVDLVDKRLEPRIRAFILRLLQRLRLHCLGMNLPPELRHGVARRLARPRFERASIDGYGHCEVLAS